MSNTKADDDKWVRAVDEAVQLYGTLISNPAYLQAQANYYKARVDAFTAAGFSRSEAIELTKNTQSVPFRVSSY